MLQFRSVSLVTRDTVILWSCSSRSPSCARLPACPALLRLGLLFFPPIRGYFPFSQRVNPETSWYVQPKADAQLEENRINRNPQHSFTHGKIHKEKWV